MEGISLRFWHGGLFKKGNNGHLDYVGGMGRVFTVDPDQLCGFFLEELAMKCGNYSKIEGIYYALLGKSLDQGLRRVYADSEVLEMDEIGIKNRGIDLYVLYSVDKPDILDPKEVGHSASPKPNTPTKAASPNQKTPTEDEFDLYDDRPDSPIPWHILAGEIESSDSDKSYQPEGESEEDLEGSGSEGLIPEPRHREVDEEFEAEFITEGECGKSEEDTSDEELINARKNVKGFNTRLFEIATQLQQEAAERRLGYQRNEGATPCTRNEQAEVLSEYENSSDECHSPPESEDEGVGGILREQKKSVCITTTDFSKFQWEIGQRFASRLEFRAAVTKYAICQGRDLFFSVSSKNRNQRLGVKCKSGCPFTLYASWDNNKASFVVKSTEPEQTCHRTMENNRQLKSTWLADEFLEFFKARPHCPAAEIIDTVRRAYRVLILRDKAYKVKYWAHKKLHGSMKEHYNKLVRYVEALKLASPESVFLLQTDPQVNTLPPVFQRLFLCFDGLKRGWLSGCRRVLAVDGCFLKTFLGGQLLAAIGRDGNDQMFPLAWAVVEGESNDSWEWFFLNLQQCMEAGEGAGWTVVSDEHQGILNACAKVFPAAEHRHCARHIFAHWHKDFRGDEMRDLFWRAAKAYNQADFEDTLSDMEKVNPAAAISFRRYNPQVVCRAFLNTESKCDVVTSNMAETFNGYVIQARTKHIIYMFEEIRGKLMYYHVVFANQRAIQKGCPDKGKEVEQQPKRPRGRPRKDGSTPTSTSQAPQIQSEVTAEPSRTGRHGRVIVSGRGSRGVGRGRGGGRAGQFATTGGAGQGRGRSGGGQRGGRGGVQATGRSNMVGSREPTVLTNSGWLSMQQATQQSQASSSKHTSFATSLG
ncbi:hypothetical protein RDABS01_021403 [Bienertia sinuspersici]